LTNPVERPKATLIGSFGVPFVLTKAPQNAGTSARKQPKGSGAAFAYNQLRAEILDLRLKPGTPLDEGEIGRRLGVSRSPVREAIIRLSAEGLAESLRNRSAVVASFDIEDLPSYFDALRIVYRLTARQAARRVDATKIIELEAIQDELELALSEGRPLDIISLNRMFHDKIAAIAGNRWFAQWQRSLLDQGQRIFRIYVKHYGDAVPSHQVEYHRVLIRALRNGDAEAADIAGAADAEIIGKQLAQFIFEQRVGSLVL
jgi:DNA-binding GntR family transcriptional regulator